MIEQLVPDSGAIDVTDLVGRLAISAPETAPPFAPETIEFCAQLAAELSRSPEARASGELQALAYWIRRSALKRLRDGFESLQTERTLLMPQGLVFHLPPSNVDTMFVYSWVLSLLMGNRNVVRLSERRSPQTAAICATIARLVEAPLFAAVRRSTAIVTYGHDAAVTSAISAIADVRVIWGGDAAVTAVRSVPLPPHARELTFVDRSSFSVIATEAYLALDAGGRQGLARRFFADAYWFNQGACSSPRLLVWCGAPHAAQLASRRFFDELRGVADDKGYVVDAGTALNKFAYSCRAVLDTAVSRYERLGNAVTVLELESGAEVPIDHCGAGLFYEIRVAELAHLAEFVQRRDQTMTYFGFGREALHRLAARLNGRGIDRMVPIGQALTFNRFWDGVDFLQEMSRRVYVETES